MKATYTENILTINTEIPVKLAEKCPWCLVCKDFENEEKYRISIDKTGTNGKILSCGLICNTVVNGCLGVVITFPMGTTLDDVKLEFGERLVIAKTHVEDAALDMNMQSQALANLFIN